MKKNGFKSITCCKSVSGVEICLAHVQLEFAFTSLKLSERRSEKGEGVYSKSSTKLI